MQTWSDMLQKICVLALFFLLFLSILNIFFDGEICRATNGEVFYVGGIRDKNYTWIQDAIDAANDNDIVIVYSGIYSENIFINKSLKLIGENNPVINGQSKMCAVLMECSNTNITGFTIQNSKIGIYVGGSSNLSHNNIMKNIIVNNTDGIYLQDSSNSNNITGNIFENNYEAIRLYNSSSNNIKYNTFNQHIGRAIHLLETSNKNNISRNNINHTMGIALKRWSNNNIISYNNIKKGCIELDYSYGNDINNNYLSNCKEGITLSYSHGNNITENRINNSDIGIYLIDSDENIISPNSFLNNNQDVKEKTNLPGVKTPGFEIFFVILSIVIFVFLKKK